MIVSIHQPAYLPWLGYLTRIHDSDVFVFLDTVQFEKGSFTNRNRIKTAAGPCWLTVPIRHRNHLDKPLVEIEIDNDRNWRRKHLRTIEQNYCRARFAGNIERLHALLGPTDHSLTELCFRQLTFWLEEFGIATQIVRASDLPVDGRKSELILALCRHLGATCFLSGPMGRRYLDESSFARAGIRVAYHAYRDLEYPQLHGDFIPALSVVDYWMNCGNSDRFKL